MSPVLGAMTPLCRCIHGQVVGLSAALADNLWILPTDPLP
jgi:hypothetical protein